MTEKDQIPEIESLEPVEEADEEPLTTPSSLSVTQPSANLEGSQPAGSQASARQTGGSHSNASTGQSRSKKKSEDAEDPFLGALLKGTFRIEKKIGEGGMGNVYAAVQRPLDREVAVKILKPSDTNPEGEHYFLREVKAINMLRHPNIINIVDFGKTEDDILYLVMEYLPGRTLKRVIKKEFPIDPIRICEICKQVLSALEQAHQTGIVHCDLKPANVMVERVAGQNDFVKVLDFGIAKVKEPGQEVGPYTQQGNIVGTFDYMSPEQIMRKDLDGRADVWSMGVIMYEMLTRKRIFHDKDAVSIIGRVMQMPIQPPSSFESHIPDVMDEVVMKAMERNVNKRFSSADDMRQALEHAIEVLRGTRDSQTLATSGSQQDYGEYPDSPSSASGSLAHSGLVRGDSGPISRSGPVSRSGPIRNDTTSDTGPKTMRTRSGVSSDASSAMGTSVASGTSVLDQTFSVEELKGSLLGEKRKVAVMAVKQRSRQEGDLDSEEVARRSRKEAGIVKEVVEHYDGKLDSFLGGTFTILFGAERARVGDNVRAIECAVELQERLRELPQGAAHIGISVGYGEVSVSRAKDGNAYGDAIDRTIGVAAAAENATVLADASIMAVTKQQVDYDVPRTIKGDEAAEVLRVTEGHSEMREGDDLDDVDVFVPRPELFDQLSRMAADVRNNHGGGVAILGEMGVGKSVLLERFAEEKAEGDWSSFLVRTEDTGRHQTLAPVLGWIRQISETYSDPRKLVFKACQTLGMNRGLENVVEFFANEDARIDPHSLPWQSPEGLSQFAAALLHRLIRFAIKSGPVILAIDDINVGDEVLMEFIDGLLSRIDKMPVLVLASRRVEAGDSDHGLPGNFDILRIGGLSEPQSKQFVAQLLGHTPPMRIVRQLHSRSNGNPMFLGELVRSLSRVHGGKLMDIDDLDASGIPLNIHELLAERVDELPGDLRDLLRLASVLGDSFREEWFFQITPSHLSPRENLEELVARGVIEARFDDHGRVTLAFNPRVLREVVYDRLPDQTRIDIHSRVIEFLESAPEVAAVDAFEVPMMLAFHYESVDGNQGAAHYRHEAGEMFLDVYEYPPAIEQFQKALTLLDRIDAVANSPERLKVLASLLVAYRESGRLQAAQRIVERLPPVDDIPEQVLAEILHEVGLIGIESGSIEESEARLTRLVEMSRERGDAKFEVKGMLGLAQLYEKQNELSRAADILLAVSEKVENMGHLDLSDPDDRKLFWTAYNQLGTLFIRQKDFQKAQQFLNTALNRAQQIEDHRGLVRVLSNLGALCLSIRDVGRARDYFSNAVKAAKGIGDLLNQSRIESNLGIAAMEQNDFEASKKHFKKARSIAEDIGWYEGLAELSRHIKRLKKAMGR